MYNSYMSETNMEMMSDNMCPNQMNTCDPIMECPQEKCVDRFIYYDVPHIIPMNTKIINHHVYRHTYQPMYTCSSIDVCSEIKCPNQFNF